MNSLGPSSSPNDGANQFKRIGYLRLEPSTSARRLRPAQLEPELCTHLVLVGARISAHCELVAARASDLELLSEIGALKRRHAHLRVLLSVTNEPPLGARDGQALAPSGCSSARLISLENPSQVGGQTNSGGGGGGSSSRLTESQDEGEGNLNNNNNNLLGPNQLPHELRARFAKSALEFLQRFQLDGLELDWKPANFPASLLGGRESERLGLAKLLTALRSAIVENFYARLAAASASGQQQQQQQNSCNNNNNHPHQQPVEPHLLTLSLGLQEVQTLRASAGELRPLANLCDWLQVQTLDYYLFKPYAPFTGPQAPLYPIVEPYVPLLSKLSLSWTAQRLLHEELLPSDKLVLTIPTQARAYRLMFRQPLGQQPSAFTLALGPSSRLEIGRQTTGARPAAAQVPPRDEQQESQQQQQRTDELEADEPGGQLDYGQVLELLARPDARVQFDERAQAPYLLSEHNSTWVSFENERSVRAKVQFIMQNQLAGYATWTLNSDAHSANGGRTEAEEFPLHRAMLREVEEASFGGQKRTRQ